MLFRREKSKKMSDDKLQLTTSDYNDEAANEYAAAAEYEPAQAPSYAAAEVGSITMPMPVTSSQSGDRPLSETDQHSCGLPAIPAVPQSDRDPCSTYDTSLQRPNIASTYCTTSSCRTTSLPVDNYQQRQQQQMIREPRFTDDTPRRTSSCTPKTWVVFGIYCLVIKLIIIFFIIFFGIIAF